LAGGKVYMAILTCCEKLTCYILSGNVSFDELMEALKKFWEESLTENILWDLRNATFGSLSENEIDAIDEYVQGHVVKRIGGKTAMLVHTDVDYTIGNIFMSRAQDHMPFQLKVFRTLEEAVEWLGKEE
jgi:hypothetical protein